MIFLTPKQVQVCALRLSQLLGNYSYSFQIPGHHAYLTNFCSVGFIKLPLLHIYIQGEVHYTKYCSRQYQKHGANHGDLPQVPILGPPTDSTSPIYNFYKNFQIVIPDEEAWKKSSPGVYGKGRAKLSISLGLHVTSRQK